MLEKEAGEREGVMGNKKAAGVWGGSRFLDDFP